jgi:RND family efflux transporter MFP subunit
MKYIVKALIVVIVLFSVSCKSKKEKETVSRKITNIPVNVETIKPASFKHFIKVSGNVEPVNYAFISPESPGQIKQILVSEGSTVKKGQTLIIQNTSVIDGQILQVKSQLNLAKLTFEKQNELWNNKHVGSEIQFLNAKTQKEALENQLKTLQSQRAMAIIRAPFSGIVDRINKKVGELASPGMQLIELVNLRKMKIKADVSEHLLPVIHKGDSVIISFPTYNNFMLKAPIYRTGNIINPANRTFTIELRVNNKNSMLKPFMISSLEIIDFAIDQAITVPSIIVKKDFDKEFVFITSKTDSNLVATKVYIETGRSYQERTVVTSGLKAGEQVIVNGYNKVSTGVAIDIQ